MSVKRKRDHSKPVQSPTVDAFKQDDEQNAVGKSAVGAYADVIDFEERYKRAVVAFRRETSVILGFDSPIHSLFGAYRQESVKTFILKILLFVGVSPNGNALAVLARLIEMFTVHPELSLDEVISDFAVTHQTNVESVTRIMEKHFYVYDNYFYDRVVQLTKSHPMTPKDVLCDLSVLVRLKFASVKAV